MSIGFSYRKQGGNGYSDYDFLVRCQGLDYNLVRFHFYCQVIYINIT